MGLEFIFYSSISLAGKKENPRIIPPNGPLSVCLSVSPTLSLSRFSSCIHVVSQVTCRIGRGGEDCIALLVLLLFLLVVVGCFAARPIKLIGFD